VRGGVVHSSHPFRSLGGGGGGGGLPGVSNKH
jgi:hypothetical protein